MRNPNAKVASYMDKESTFLLLIVSLISGCYNKITTDWVAQTVLEAGKSKTKVLERSVSGESPGSQMTIFSSCSQLLEKE